MEDLGIEAKEAAVREVAKLLPSQDLLSSIASIKADYLSRQQVTPRDPSLPAPLGPAAAPLSPLRARSIVAESQVVVGE